MLDGSNVKKTLPIEESVYRENMQSTGGDFMYSFLGALNATKSESLQALEAENDQAGHNEGQGIEEWIDGKIELNPED